MTKPAVVYNMLDKLGAVAQNGFFKLAKNPFGAYVFKGRGKLFCRRKGVFLNFKFKR